MLLLPRAFRGDRPAHRRPGRHGGAEHTAPGRGAEGGATGHPHCGRLRPGEQDGEGFSGHPPGHRLHRLPVHPLSSGGGADGWSPVFLCGKGVRMYGGRKSMFTEDISDVPAKPIYRMFTGRVQKDQGGDGSGRNSHLLYNNKMEMKSTVTNVSSFSPYRGSKTGSCQKRSTSVKPGKSALG